MKQNTTASSPVISVPLPRGSSHFNQLQTNPVTCRVSYDPTRELVTICGWFILPRAKFISTQPDGQGLGHSRLQRRYATNVVVNHKTDGAGVTSSRVYKFLSFACVSIWIQKYYRNNTKRWGGGGGQNSHEINEEITMHTKHTVLTWYKDRRSHLSISLIQYLIQRVSAYMVVIGYYIYVKYPDVFYNCST
jgi:hypothetical protein